jgi:ankyrin repeat protein
MQPPSNIPAIQEFTTALEAGNLPEVRRLVEAGADVNAVTDIGLTPLLLAYNHDEILRYLLSRGANPNYTGFREGSPLTLASYDGNLERMAMYLEAGADVNLAMPEGGETALHMAAVKGKTEPVRLLLRAGGDPNCRASAGVPTDMFNGGVRLWGETPLHFAAAYGDREMVEAMLEAGADKAIPNAHGETPLAYAGRHQRPREILNLLK